MATREGDVTGAQGAVAGSQLEDRSKQEFLSDSQIHALMEVQDMDEIQKLLEEFLNVQDPEINLKKAIELEYYVAGFCWGKDRNFNLQQLSGLMGLLYLLMENVLDKRMSLEENVLELAKALTGVGHRNPLFLSGLRFFNIQEAKDIISYFKISLFQHYKLYECMLTVPRDQMVIKAEQIVEIPKPAETPFPVPLEEGIPCEMYVKFLAPPDAKDGEMVEAEINEKLRVQEEAFTSKIENLQKP